MADAYICRRGGSGSGGGDLVLQVLNGSTRPAKPAQNMIWLNTEHETTGYVFTATAPESPAEGMAWISVGDSGSIKVGSPVGENWVTVYLLSAKQYIEGEWVGIPAYCYQNGEWAMWFDGSLFDGYLFNNGIVNEDVTGGWMGTDALATVGTTLYGYNGNVPYTYAGECKTVKPVDLTNYTTLKVNRISGNGVMAVGVNEGTGWDAVIYPAENGVLSLDISAINGERYICLSASANSRYTVDSVWLE